MLLWSFGFTLLSRTPPILSSTLLIVGWGCMVAAAWFQLESAMWGLVPLIYLQISLLLLWKRRWENLNQVISAFARHELQFRTVHTSSDKPLRDLTQNLYGLSRDFDALNSLSDQLCSEMKFSTQELENLAKHTADAASEQQNELLTIASASEEMSQTVQLIRDHILNTHNSL